jgi:TolA-binding protein
MVTTRSEALRGPWGSRTKKHQERGGNFLPIFPDIGILNERIAQMEKEMQELEKKNAALQQRNVEDSHSATLQPSKDGEQDGEERATDQGDIEVQGEREKHRGVAGQRPPRRKSSKKADKILKEIIKRLEQRCDLLSVAVQTQPDGSKSKAGDLFQKSVSPFVDNVVSFHLP